MFNLYDDSYDREEYTCCKCDQKEYLLREASIEISKVMDCVLEMKRSHSSIEERLLSNLENACHMVGIPFKG